MNPRSACLFVQLLALVSASIEAAAADYPVRPIRLIVADAAGGAPDQLARILAQKLTESLGQQVIVDNRPGAAGVLGAGIAAKSSADGYSLLLTTTAIYAIVPNLRKNLPYDPVRNFVPIARLASASNVLVVNASLPAKSVADLVRHEIAQSWGIVAPAGTPVQIGKRLNDEIVRTMQAPDVKERV